MLNGTEKNRERVWQAGGRGRLPATPSLHEPRSGKSTQSMLTLRAQSHLASSPRAAQWREHTEGFTSGINMIE